MSNNGNDNPLLPDEQAQEEPEKLATPAAPAADADELAEEGAHRALSDALRVSFAFLKVALVAVVCIFLLSGVFWVEPQEIKFKLRFGAVTRPRGQAVLRSGQGVYIRWPLWEEVITLPRNEQVLALSHAFWTRSDTGTGPVRPTAKLDVREDHYLITGDTNIVHLRLRARYRIREDDRGAMAYAFYVADPEAVLERLLKAAATNVVGTMPVMDVIQADGLWPGIEAELRVRLADFEAKSGVPLGVELIAVEAAVEESVKNPSEPGAVSQAFTDAQNAVSERNRLEDEGKTRATRILNQARARAVEIEAGARGDAVALVRGARADAEVMERLLPIYKRSPAVASILLDRYYQRAIEDIMDASPGSFILHEPAEGTRQELRLMLARAPQARQAPNSGQ